MINKGQSKKKILKRLVFVAVMGVMATMFKKVDVSAATNAKIHFVTINDSTNAILLECDGHFGMVDSGEDNDMPDGTDPRYPIRPGISVIGYEDQVIAYMHSVGVTTENFDFYIGTHPHSDHIGSADEVIREFRPKRVYIGEYNDSMITATPNLWDNQYVYDRMIAAAKEVGATIIQRFDGVKPVEYNYYNDEVVIIDDGAIEATEDLSSFSLGDGMIITIMNDDVDRYKGFFDANCFSWGVLVEANGQRAFLSGDINNYFGCEDKLLNQLGHIDLLNIGHHGCTGSSSYKYVTGLNPSYIVVCGRGYTITNTKQYGGPGVFDTLMEMCAKGCKVFATGHYTNDAPAIVFNIDNNITNNIPDSYRAFTSLANENGECKSVLLRNGVICNDYTGFAYDGRVERYFSNSEKSVSAGWVEQNGLYYYIDADGENVQGWEKIDGKWYYFMRSGQLMSGQWLDLDDIWYYLKSDGSMATGWYQVNGKWYYFRENGSMEIGWKKVNGKWYYLEMNGQMATGWKKINDEWYYLKESGAMATGWIELGSKWYYLYPDGHMASNEMVNGYTLGPNGEWTK